MTLLGKIFRPWDLPSGGTGLTHFLPPADETQVNENSRKGRMERKQQLIPGRTSATAASSSKESLSPVHKIRSHHHRRSNSINNPNSKCPSRLDPELRGEGVGMSENEKEVPDSPAASISCSEPMTPTDLSDFRHFSPSFPGTNNLSNIFLYPNTINDLANLSKNELAVMGLLPLDTSSHNKVKRQRPKRFHCPHCQVAFSNNGQLKGHVRIHTGNFRCCHVWKE